MTESITSTHHSPIAVLAQPIFPFCTHVNAIIFLTSSVNNVPQCGDSPGHTTIVMKPIGNVPQYSPDKWFFSVAEKIPFHLNILTTLATAKRMKRTTLKMNTTTPRRRNQPPLKGKLYRRIDVMPVPILKAIQPIVSTDCQLRYRKTNKNDPQKNAGEMFNIACSTRLITRRDRFTGSSLTS